MAGKFQQKVDRLGWRPESQVYRRHGGNNFILLRNLQRMHLALRAPDRVAPAMNHFVFSQTNVFYPSLQAARQLEKVPPSHHAKAPEATVLWARQREQIFQPLERVVERFRLLHSGQQGAASLVDSRQERVELRKRFLRLENADEGQGSLIARITRRARRVEERPVDPPPTLLPGTPGAHGEADFVHEAPRFVPVREISSTGPDDPMLAGAPAMPFNMVQLTDEVMRHLDRRLVAARERMGKI